MATEQEKKKKRLGQDDRTVTGLVLRKAEEVAKNLGEFTKDFGGAFDIADKVLGGPGTPVANTISEAAPSVRKLGEDLSSFVPSIQPSVSTEQLKSFDITKPNHAVRTSGVNLPTLGGPSGSSNQRNQAAKGISGGAQTPDASGTGAGSTQQKPQTLEERIGQLPTEKPSPQLPIVGGAPELSNKTLELIQSGTDIGKPGGTFNTLSSEETANIQKSADAQLERDKLALIKQGVVPISEIDTDPSEVLAKLKSGAFGQSEEVAQAVLDNARNFERNKQIQDIQRRIDFINFKLGNANPIEQDALRAQLKALTGQQAALQEQQGLAEGLKSKEEVAKINAEATQRSSALDLAKLGLQKRKVALDILEKRKDRKSRQQAEALKLQQKFIETLSKPEVSGINAIPALQGLAKSGARQEALTIAVQKGFNSISKLKQAFPEWPWDTLRKNRQFVTRLAQRGVRQG